MVRYYEGETPVTAVINFTGTSPVVTCFGTNTTTPLEIDELFASLDLSLANEQFASSSSNTCSESELCPSIFPYSFIFSTNDGSGENFRGVSGNSRAQFYAQRGLRTSGLNRRKSVLKLALKELQAFVITSSYRAASASYKRSIVRNIELTKRAVISNAGPKQVRAALLAIRGR